MKVIPHLLKPFVVLLILALNFQISRSQQPIRIMPLGNSITEGDAEISPSPENRIGYRYALYYKLLAAGYSFDFVGSQDNGQNRFPDYQHAGIAGSRDQYVARLLLDGYDDRNDVQILNPPRPYLDDFDPDIILLHIGTNDITHEGEPSDDDYPAGAAANEKVSLILNRIDEYEARSGREVIVFLALIINRQKPCYAGSGCSSTSDFNEVIESMALARIANGDKIVIVDMEHVAGFNYDATDMQDQLHPNEGVGYPKMAQLWLTSIQLYYNSAPYGTPIPNQTVPEGGNFSVISLDNYVMDTEDVDSDISWTATQLSGSNLSISISGGRVASISAVDPNWNGSQMVVFKGTDTGNSIGNFSKSYSDTVLFTVTEMGDPPLITAQSDLIVNEGESITLSLSNFTISDPDSDPSTFSLKVLPGSDYTVVGDIVTPSPNFDSDITVNVAVTDESSQGPFYAALLQIIPSNDPPVYSGQSAIAIDEDTYYDFNFADISVSDADHTISELTIVMEDEDNYTLSANRITPDENYFGELNIPCYITDPEGGKTDDFVLNITVNSINDSPKFTSEPLDTAELGEFYIYVINGSDVDDTELEITVVDKPEWLPYNSNIHSMIGKPGNADKNKYFHTRIELSDGESTVAQDYYIFVDGDLTAVDPIMENVLRIYPNPAIESITIEGDFHSKKGVFTLYDSKAQMVLKHNVEPINGSKLSIQNMNLDAGVYLYTIFIDNLYYTGKIVIQSH